MQRFLRSIGKTLAIIFAFQPSDHVFAFDATDLSKIEVSRELPAIGNIVFKPIGRIPILLQISGSFSGVKFKLSAGGYGVIEKKDNVIIRTEYIENASIYMSGNGKSLNEDFHLTGMYFSRIHFDDKFTYRIDLNPRLAGLFSGVKGELFELLLSTYQDSIPYIIPRRIERFDIGIPIYENSANAFRSWVLRDLINPYRQSSDTISYLNKRGFSIEDVTAALSIIKEYNSDVSIGGSTTLNGHSYVHASGRIYTKYQLPKQQHGEGGGDVIMLIDPFSGLTRLVEFDGHINMPDLRGGINHIKMKTRFEYEIESIFSKRNRASKQYKVLLQDKLTISEAYRRSIDSVFTVKTPESIGAAFAITPRILITNQHVVGRANVVVLKGHQGENYRARVLHTSDQIDLSVLETDEPITESGLKLSPDFPLVGEPALVIGSPAGLEGSVTAGIVSQLRLMPGVSLIQLDAPISEGNSGGPVIDLYGRVIGVATFKASPEKGYEGLSFAISSPSVLETLLAVRPDLLVKR